MLSRVFQRHTKQDTPLWLRQSRRRATDVKALAEEGSVGRMAALNEIDRVREQAQAEEHIKRKVRDRRLLTASLALFIVLVCLGVAAVIIASAK